MVHHSRIFVVWSGNDTGNNGQSEVNALVNDMATAASMDHVTTVHPSPTDNAAEEVLAVFEAESATFDVKTLRTHLKTTDWNRKEEVEIIWKEEGEEKYHVCAIP